LSNRVRRPPVKDWVSDALNEVLSDALSDRGLRRRSNVKGFRLWMIFKENPQHMGIFLHELGFVTALAARGAAPFF